MRLKTTLFIGVCLVLGVISSVAVPTGLSGEGDLVTNGDDTVKRVRDHLRELTVTIGERSVKRPENLERTARYIETFYENLGLPVERESYRYRGTTVANVIARVDFAPAPSRHYLLGAHYDTVAGTVGADDNGSAIAVQLETARQLQALRATRGLDLSVKLVSFTLEEPPAFGTRAMGSRVHARNAKKRGEKIDGMICLEMVGYTCAEPGCQSYPFPLMLMDYPKKGTFIGIAGNFGSRGLTNGLYHAFQGNENLPVIKLTVPFGGWLLPSVRLSDHSSFWDEGYRAVMVTDSAFYRNPNYHQHSDTMDKLDWRFMAELVRSLVMFFAEAGSGTRR
jgi:Zn-dependent M28 family amino/carboxypeptidase